MDTVDIWGWGSFSVGLSWALWVKSSILSTPTPIMTTTDVPRHSPLSSGGQDHPAENLYSLVSTLTFRDLL